MRQGRGGVSFSECLLLRRVSMLVKLRDYPEINRIPDLPIHRYICNRHRYHSRFVRFLNNGTEVAAGSCEIAGDLCDRMCHLFQVIDPNSQPSIRSAWGPNACVVVRGPFDRPIVTDVRVDGCRGGSSSRE